MQLWLALAYQATGREEECLDTYRTLERTHPLPAIRRQAEQLRYIMEAPKLTISPEERVQIPVLTDLEANRRVRGGGGWRGGSGWVGGRRWVGGWAERAEPCRALAERPPPPPHTHTPQLTAPPTLTPPLCAAAAAGRSGRAPVSRQRPAPARRVPKTWDEEFWESWSPPVYIKNRYVWAAATALAAGLAVYSTRLRL